MTLEIREENFPYWSKGDKTVKKVDIYVREKNKNEISSPHFTGTGEVITYEADGTKKHGEPQALTDIRIPAERFALKIILDFEKNSMEDLWLALTWGRI